MSLDADEFPHGDDVPDENEPAEETDEEAPDDADEESPPNDPVEED